MLSGLLTLLGTAPNIILGGIGNIVTYVVNTIGSLFNGGL